MQRTILSLLLFLLFSFVSFGQDNEDNDKLPPKLEFHSVSFSPLDFYITDQTEGLSIKLDLAIKKERHIFKLQGSFGLDFATISQGSSKPENFYELNLLYGREISINNWLYYDVFGGVGLFIATEYNDQSFKTQSSTVGIPIQNRLRFQTKSKFGAGLQFQINLNSLKTIYSPGFFIQLKF